MRKGGLYIALGDSTTQQYVTNFQSDELYANIVWNWIKDNHALVRHLNKGINGARAVDIGREIHRFSFEADLVTICFGINDWSSLAFYTVADYTNSLKKIIDYYRKKNPEVHIILCTSNTQSDSTSNTGIQEFRDAMAAVSVEKSCGLVRFETLWNVSQTATYTFDGVHPNSSGHALMGSALITEVQNGAWLQEIG